MKMSEDEEEQTPDRSLDEEADVVTRETPVGHAVGRLGLGSCIVGEDDTLIEMTEALAEIGRAHV